MSRRIVVDLQVCQLNALCVATAPDLFEISEDDVLCVADIALDDEAMRLAERAAECCPTGAIRIVSQG